MARSNAGTREAAGRDRLLATARDLFTRHGAANVGINDVTAAAGVARMTLYNNFPSKDALIVAVYEDMAQATLHALRGIDMSERSEEDRILAIFDHFDRCAREAEYRGCPLTHASFQAAEANGAVYAVVKAYKRELREHVFRALGPGRRNRAELADQLLLLLDGAVIEVYLKGVADPMAVAKLAATTLLRTPQ